MMRKWMMAGVLAVLAMLTLRWLTADGDGETLQNTQQSPASKAAAAGTKATEEPLQTASWPPPFPELRRVPLPDYGPQQAAAQSLAATRNGDPRSPPLQRDTVSAVQPSAAELADPQAYQRYEASQHQQLLASFASAAQQEVPRLKADIEHGRQMGIDPASIAKMEDKARRLAALEQELRHQHPEWQSKAR